MIRFVTCVLAVSGPDDKLNDNEGILKAIETTLPGTKLAGKLGAMIQDVEDLNLVEAK